ncbi:hypothetical protein V7O66_13890 [Methanolobus sp. ZRKC3]|uniref:hypothetical protein n=1 Tax=Methanolobus sp. ZRKC3 TaxID=3125786 RepID=UPI0032505AA0
MKLNKETMAPILEQNGFSMTTANTWVIFVDNKRYLVDFKNEHICRTDGEHYMERVQEDPEDTFLTSVKEMLSPAMVEESKEVEDTSEKQCFADDVCGEESSKDTNVPENNKVIDVTPTAVTVLPDINSADIVRPAISALAAKQAWQEYLDMRNIILEKSDFQKIQGKDFIKKSGWRKFATYYNLTDKITEEKRIQCEDGSFIWKIKVVCMAANGRQTEGVAMCSSKEKSGPRIEHDVYSTAHTRAKNRAISDMIAAGEVSAEEVQA